MSSEKFDGVSMMGGVADGTHSLADVQEATLIAAMYGGYSDMDWLHALALELPEAVHKDVTKRVIALRREHDFAIEQRDALRGALEFVVNNEDKDKAIDGARMCLELLIRAEEELAKVQP